LQASSRFDEGMMKTPLVILILVSFLMTGIAGPLPAHAQINSKEQFPWLPAPGTMVNLTTAYMPVMIKGVRVHPDNPLLFDFILDTGNSGLKINSTQFKEESQKLIKYFLTALTIKEEDLWVNLSPYEKDRMIPQELGKTEMGRDMLAQDYILKQLTASLIYPERALGKKFWDKVYTKTRQIYGVTNIPVNTFNKVWIVADKAKVLERNNAAYVVGAHLKVMLEEDYLAMEKHFNNDSLPLVGRVREGGNNTHNIASQVIRTIILPALEVEINQGQNFAPLRQMFYSMILASWYKLSLKNALLNQVYSNKSKIAGLGHYVIPAKGPHTGHSRVAPGIHNTSQQDLSAKEIYQQYLKAYKKGVFNYIKEDVDESSQQTLPRKYFSGGEEFCFLPELIDRSLTASPEEIESIVHNGDLAMVTTQLKSKIIRTIQRSSILTGLLSMLLATSSITANSSQVTKDSNTKALTVVSLRTAPLKTSDSWTKLKAKKESSTKVITLGDPAYEHFKIPNHKLTGTVAGDTPVQSDELLREYNDVEANTATVIYIKNPDSIEKTIKLQVGQNISPMSQSLDPTIPTAQALEAYRHPKDFDAFVINKGNYKKVNGKNKIKLPPGAVIAIPQIQDFNQEKLVIGYFSFVMDKTLSADETLLFSQKAFVIKSFNNLPKQIINLQNSHPPQVKSVSNDWSHGYAIIAPKEMTYTIPITISNNSAQVIKIGASKDNKRKETVSDKNTIFIESTFDQRVNLELFNPSLSDSVTVNVWAEPRGGPAAISVANINKIFKFNNKKRKRILLVNYTLSIQESKSLYLSLLAGSNFPFNIYIEKVHPPIPKIPVKSLLSKTTIKKDQSMTTPGGIDLSAKNMDLTVAKEGQGIKINSSIMIAEFQKEKLTGVEGIILRIIPIKSPLTSLGLEAPKGY